MREVLCLTRLELLGVWGINKFRRTKNPKAKNRYRLLLRAWALLIALAVFYVGALAYGLCSLGMGQLVPSYLAMIASLLVLAFGIFSVGAAIFSRQGYEILIPMPVHAGAVVLSRFLALYVQDLVLTLVVMLPGAVILGGMTGQGISFWLAFLAAALLLPGIPLVLSALLGTVIMGLSSGMKHKSLVQTGLMLILVLVVLLGSFRQDSASAQFTPEALQELSRTIGALIGQIYPPALWLGKGVLGDICSLMLYGTVSLGAVALAVLLATRFFRSIMEKLSFVSARHNYKLGEQKRTGLGTALYRRELRRYFSSSIYVINTIIGPIMSCILAGGLCFGGLEAIAGELPLDIAPLLPFVFAGVSCMMTTSSCSLSLEGRQFWVIQSLPIPAKALLDSKLLLNLSLLAPFYLLSEMFLVIALKPGFWELLFLLLIPAEIMVFAVVFGITVNLKLHSFDWEKEEQIVKQSASSMLGGFAGPLLSLALGGLVFLVPQARWLIGFLLPLLTLALYRRNNKVELARL